MKKITLITFLFFATFLAYSQEVTLEGGSKSINKIYDKEQHSFHYVGLSILTSNIADSEFYLKFESLFYIKDLLSSSFYFDSIEASLKVGAGISKFYSNIGFIAGIDVSVNTQQIEKSIYSISVTESIITDVYFKLKFF